MRRIVERNVGRILLLSSPFYERCKPVTLVTKRSEVCLWVSQKSAYRWQYLLENGSVNFDVVILNISDLFQRAYTNNHFYRKDVQIPKICLLWSSHTSVPPSA